MTTIWILLRTTLWSTLASSQPSILAGQFVRLFVRNALLFQILNSELRSPRGEV